MATLYWFQVTTTQASGQVAVNEHDCIVRAPRAFAWWINRPMETFVETMEKRGVLVSVEAVQR
jgi:hypothetical protein